MLATPHRAYDAEQRRCKALELLLSREWDTMGDLDEWDRIRGRVVNLVSAAQVGAAHDSALAVHLSLVEAGTPVAADGTLSPAAFAGVTDIGGDLEPYLYGSVAHARTVEAGSVRDRLREGRDRLFLLAREQVGAASRGASLAGIASRDNVGYVRLVNPPCCSRCAVLSGKFFRWNTGFQRHPRCFPAGVVISGPSIEAATRRWFDGELVIITTASGQELAITGNHPVLTPDGWVPANLVQAGVDVVRSTRPQGAAPLVAADHAQLPARVEDVWGSLSVRSLEQVSTSPEDFHGDGCYGEVEVVGADSAPVLDAAIGGQRQGHSRWDAPGERFSLESRERYAAVGRALLDRLADQVELDRVVERRSVEFRGQVFSVTSQEGWHTANGLLVSNCDCRHVPAVGGRRLPDGLTDTLDVDQITDLNAGEIAAIDAGADLAQVLNSKRGRRNGGLTVEGTTRRGWHGRPVRLTPQAALHRARSREEFMQLLADNGYLLPRATATGVLPVAA